MEILTRMGAPFARLTAIRYQAKSEKLNEFSPAGWAPARWLFSETPARLGPTHPTKLARAGLRASGQNPVHVELYCGHNKPLFRIFIDTPKKFSSFSIFKNPHSSSS